MKKLKFQGKLSLNKETIANLSAEQMEQVNGGLVEAWPRLSIFRHCGLTCSPCKSWNSCVVEEV